MNIKDLECFILVYEQQSMNRAAKQLYITPQGLSKNIRNLEQELETILFERSKRGVYPTESAKLLYSKAKEILRQLSEVENEIHQITNQKQVLRIGCANGVFHVLPLSTILTFMQENPHIHVEWCEYSNEEVTNMLSASKLEYGFVVGKQKNTNLLQRPIISRKVKVLVYEGHPLYNEKYIRLNMLQGEELLLMNEHFSIYHDVIESCHRQGFIPSIRAKTSEGSVLVKLCIQKLGLAIVPDFLVEQDIAGVRAIPFQEKFTWDVYGTILRENKEFEVIQKFDEYIQAYLCQ